MMDDAEVEQLVASIAQKYAQSPERRRKVLSTLKARIEQLETAPDEEIAQVTAVRKYSTATTSDFAPMWKSVAARRQDLESNPPAEKKIRVLMLGCFDVMHSGHYNALRQSKALGDELIAGVHSNESILANKGPPVMTDEERMLSAAACKWVDEVVGFIPYEVNCKLLDDLGCDFCVHGDDLPQNLNGNMYEEVITSGRCRIIRRTEGVSSTDLLGRMLSLSRAHISATASAPATVLKGVSNFLPSGRRLAQFAPNQPLQIGPNESVVYIDGAFDLFHIGHIETLQRAKQLGTYLVVGVHDDKTVNEHKGGNYPIMSLHERVFSVLSCRFVDDVIIGAPWAVTDDMISSLKITAVASGSLTKATIDYDPSVDPYAAAKARGIFQIVNASRELTTEVFVNRVLANYERFAKKSLDRGKKELEYIANKTYVKEI